MKRILITDTLKNHMNNYFGGDRILSHIKSSIKKGVFKDEDIVRIIADKKKSLYFIECNGSKVIFLFFDEIFDGVELKINSKRHNNKEIGLCISR